MEWPSATSCSTLALAAGEQLQGPARRALAAGKGGHHPRDAGRQPGVAAGHRAHRQLQLGAVGVLEQVSGRAREQRPPHVLFVLVHGEQQHARAGRFLLGARRRDILNQYLVESAVLAGAGGLIGVSASWAIAIVVRNATPVPMVLPWSSVIIGVGLSAVVGLFFGIYPARQAARLDPIEALRAEK